MSIHAFSRTELVIGNEGLAILQNSRIAVFGLGGVGGNAAEALVRSGIKELDLIDFDRVNYTNLNRQVISSLSTIGQYKTDAAEARFKSINPDIIIHKHTCMFLPENSKDIPFSSFDYIIDAIDNVTAKIELIKQAQAHHVPIICSMGCGNRLDPSRLTITDIYKTSGDPLARIMRQQCRKNHIKKLTVITSSEQPVKPSKEMIAAMNQPGKKVLGSTAFVPSVAGITAASYVVRELIKNNEKN